MVVHVEHPSARCGGEINTEAAWADVTDSRPSAAGCTSNGPVDTIDGQPYRSAASTGEELVWRNHGGDATLMKNEDRRLQTFDAWPVGHIVGPERLAAAGFYYSGVQDYVKCAFCGRSLHDWQPGDDPWHEHRRFYSDCLFHGGTSAGNVPRSHQMPAYVPQPRSDPEQPHFSDERTRLATFTTWPAHAPSPTSLARAGFYFTGTSDDEVKCFWCGGTLRHWYPREDPWMEHARWFSHCGFVVSSRSSDFVAAVATAFDESTQQRGLYYTAGEVAQSQEPVAYDIAPGEERLAPAPLSVPTVSQHAAVSSPSAVRESNPAHLAGQHGYLPERLSLSAPVSAGSSNPGLSDGGRQVHQVTEMEVAAAGEEALPNPSGASHLICRVCLAHEVESALLPCRHLAVCVQCAPTVRQCPVCCALVRGTYRVFLP